MMIAMKHENGTQIRVPEYQVKHLINKGFSVVTEDKPVSVGSQEDSKNDTDVLTNRDFVR